MSSTVASVSQTGVGSGAVTITVPTGTASGDYLVAIYFSDSDGNFASMTAPSGWTAINDSSSVATTAGFGKVFTKTATASEGTSYVFPGATGAANAIIIFRITGSGSTMNVAPTWFHGAIASTTSLVAPSITTTTTGQHICAYLLLGTNNTTTITAPAGMVGTSFRVVGDSATALACGDNPAAGSTGTKTATSNNAAATPGLGYLTMSLNVGDTAPKTGDATQSEAITQTATGVRTRVGLSTQAMSITQTATGSTGPPMKIGAAAQVMAISQSANSVLNYVGIADVNTVGINQTADSTVTKFYYFTPPTWRMHYPTAQRLWRRCYLDVGHSLLKFGASYQLLDDPDDGQIESADAVYLGGRTYGIDQTERDALAAAGYSRWITDYIGEPIPDVDYSQYGAGVYGTGPYGD